MAAQLTRAGKLTHGHGGSLGDHHDIHKLSLAVTDYDYVCYV